MGMNRFASDAPILLVISEKPYVATAALGAKAKGIDYRSIDIGILAAYLTAEATAQGLSTCILGWLVLLYQKSRFYKCHFLAKFSQYCPMLFPSL